MARKIWLVLAVSALVAGSSVLVVGPASALDLPVVDVNIEKKVVGDDPGVAFPIVLTCTSETEGPSGGTITAMGSDIELAQNDTDSFTVELKDDETETVTVELPFQATLVTCEVTENLKDADLPAGWVCESEITPDDFTLYEQVGGDAAALEGFDIPDEVDVTVVNDCTKPVVTTTTTTTAAASVPLPPKFTG